MMEFLLVLIPVVVGSFCEQVFKKIFSGKTLMKTRKIDKIAYFPKPNRFLFWIRRNAKYFVIGIFYYMASYMVYVIGNRLLFKGLYPRIPFEFTFAIMVFIMVFGFLYTISVIYCDDVENYIEYYRDKETNEPPSDRLPKA